MINNEPGDNCPECKKGVLDSKPVENCSCHINPPCSACTNAPLVCNKCDYEEDIEFVNGFRCVKNSDNTYKGWRRRDLDKTKIDYHIKSHTHFTQICEGVYPDGITKEDVLKKVKGTFGGRFEYFTNNKFKYIAYTD